MLALVSAMPEEIAQVLASLQDVSRREAGGRTFHCGTFHGVPVVAVFSRWGKVAAAATVAQLLSAWQVSELVFCGVAGAVRPGLAIGDMVVGTALIQHDMDASPLFPRYEVPLHGRAEFASDPALAARLLEAARTFVRADLDGAVDPAERRFFGIGTPGVHAGLIASGDRFFAGTEALAELRARLPRTLCVEMEGAVAAQV
ncbi:MAG TPA: 5'-methylthioadenosine/adenosylhomocysteine nucleosidase, partial [Steroidobacteraceae bacterium]|nr:5'-methylthioadenosine/adenosylhomocysteine nucleosidase [Steroidobacteraceae bacterium]